MKYAIMLKDSRVTIKPVRGDEGQFLSKAMERGMRVIQVVDLDTGEGEREMEVTMSALADRGYSISRPLSVSTVALRMLLAVAAVGLALWLL